MRTRPRNRAMQECERVFEPLSNVHSEPIRFCFCKIVSDFLSFPPLRLYTYSQARSKEYTDHNQW